MAALGGCAAIPDLGEAPSLRTPATIAADRSLASSTLAEWPGDTWWRDYPDPQLARLIEEALRDSPDVAAAMARVRQAAGLAQRAGAPLLPSVEVDGRAGVNRQSYNLGIPKEFVPRGWLDNGQIAASLNFDVDLWGRNRAALAAATSEAHAAELDARQAVLMLTTGIADAYADLARLHAERDVEQRALDIRLATQRLIGQREQNGLETRGNLRQADANVASARADLAAADEAIALRRNQLAALVGAGPDRGLTIERPAAATIAARGLPADVTTALIGRRPDVVAARSRAEAAASRIKVARADFFPAIRLEALIGLQSIGLDTLIERDSLYGQAGPAISLPIFRGGALSGQYRNARGIYDEAVADYDRTVVTAYREVADTVTSQRMLERRLTEARAALVASEDAYSIAGQRYEGGLSTFLDVLDVEDRLLAARRAVVELDARAFALDIALIRALGGGFAQTNAGAAPTPHLAQDQEPDG